MSRCELCEVDIPGGEDAQEQHNAGKRHLKLVAHREKMKHLEETSIYVKWKHLSICPNDLKEFEQFGNILRTIFRKERLFAIMEFEEKESAQRAIATGELVIDGIVIKIEKRKIDFAALKVPAAQVNVEETIEKLQKAANPLEESNILIESLVISEDEGQRRLRFCESLQRHLEEYMCSPNVTLFGSSITLIGFLDSDLDAHLHISENPQQATHVEDRNKFNLLTCDPWVFKNRRVTHSEMKRLHSADQVRLLCRIINEVRKTVGWISYPNSVLDARCPVVRLQMEKQWLLDLSINNFVGAEKTSVIDQLIRNDVSGLLRRLLVVFRFWALSNGLCRAPFNQHVGHFNAYTLNWLFIYYLMKIDVIPKLEFTSETIVNSSWNKTKLAEQYSLEEQHLIPLLKKFFVYIVETKLSELVIGPFEDKPEMPKDDFRRIYLEQDQYKDFKLSTCLNIQDPIERSHNISQNVTEEYLNTMKACMKLSLSILKKKETSLKDIFSISTRPASPKSVHNDTPEHTIKIPGTTNDISRVKAFVEKYLDEIMRAQIVNVTEPTMKRMKLDQDMSDNDLTLHLGQYEVSSAVWIGRRHIKREIVKTGDKGTLNEWELESRISDAILNGNKEREDIVISVSINISNGEAYQCFQLVQGTKEHFTNASHFVEQMFSKWSSMNFLVQ